MCREFVLRGATGLGSGAPLTPPQLEVLAGGYIESGLNTVLNIPTGAGKTWLAARAVEMVIRQGRRAIFLTPLKALAGELAQQFAQDTGVSVGVYTSDRQKTVRFHDARLLIMTPEMLDLVTRNWRRHWDWIPEVGIVVLDECHLLADQKRGSRIEGAVSRFRRLNPFSQWLALSATLGNGDEIAQWLDGVHFKSNWRPTPLRWKTSTFETPLEKPLLLRAHVEDCASAGGQSLVFVHSRRRAEALSAHLSANGLRSDFHHAGLTPPNRLLVEQRMRSRALDVLVATSTLELGVNLPVRQVILYDTAHFDGERFIPLTCNAAWQRGGRAGRPGLDETSEVIVVKPSWERNPIAYEHGRFEPIQSMLHTKDSVSEQIIVEVNANLATDCKQLERVLSESFSARQGRLPHIVDTIDEMLAAGLLKQRIDGRSQSEKLCTTSLGRIASRFMLTPSTVLLMRGYSGIQAEVTRFDLLLACCTVEASIPRIPVDFDELPALGEWLKTQRSALLGQGPEPVKKLLAVDDWALLCAFKSAMVLGEWTRRGDADAVASSLGCYPNEVHELRNSVLRLIQPFSLVLRGATTESTPSTHGCDRADSLGVLAAMIHGGLDADAASITLVEGIGPKIARQMVSVGIGDIEALANSDPSELTALQRISLRRATKWVDSAVRLLSDFSAFHYREVHGEHPRVLGIPLAPGTTDRYRLDRARRLEVERLTEGFVITGGLDQHLVSLDGMHCDCADFERGNRCKHLLAVALNHGELAAVQETVDGPPESETSFDLTLMWSKRYRGDRW